MNKIFFVLFFLATTPLFATSPIVKFDSRERFLQHWLHRSLKTEELKGWRNDETSTTTDLQSICGVNVEFHLVGDNGKNFVAYAMTNTSTEPITVQHKDIEIDMKGLRTKAPWKSEQTDFLLPTEQWYFNYIQMPAKEEFESTSQIKVFIPVIRGLKNEVCEISAVFNKKEDIVLERFTYSQIEVYLSGGIPFASTGSLQKLGDSESIISLGAQLFPVLNHGYGLQISFEQKFDHGDGSKLFSRFKHGKNYEAELSTRSLYYIYRKFLTPEWIVKYEPGIGLQETIDKNRFRKDKEKYVVSEAPVLMQSLFLTRRILMFTEGEQAVTSLYVGIGLSHVYVPNESIGGQNLNGNRFSAQLRIGAGF